MKDFGFEEYKIGKGFKGKDIFGVKYTHPFMIEKVQSF